MKKFTFPGLSTLLIFTITLIAGKTIGQSTTIFNPNDPIVSYDAANPPTQPVSGPGKWVRTSRLSWNTSSFKCYIYKGIAFRLKYPKTYVPGNGKKYPLYLFFHGVGEIGSIYDNEYQLYHGAKLHSDSVDKGVFDGYLLYPQTPTQYFSSVQLTYIQELIEQYLIPQAQVDPFRISVNGLSGGGNAAWNSFFLNQKLFAGVLPISNASSDYSIQIDANKFNRIWLFQGGLDINPNPVYGRALKNSASASGANFRYTEYPTRGHDCWYQAWAEPDYFPFLNTSHKANPWSVGGKTDFCPQETISQVIGVSAGFNGYEWRKNNELISGANTNTITATSIGIYDCRVLRGTEWSPWSPVPVELKLRTSFVSPTPEMADYASKVLPSPDGKTTVQLKAPEGAASYAWTKVGTGTVGTSNIYTAGPGTYQVVVNQSNSCPSSASLPFTVIDANGPNKPSAVKSLIANKISKTAIKLNWIIDPGAANPATNFEIYQATQSGGPYEFVGITDASTQTFTKVNLTPGVRYYYVVRAVNNTAGSGLSSEVSQTTDIDNTPPTAPTDLQITGTTRTSIAIEWGNATDDAGIEAYDIYVNGSKMYTAFSNNYIISNLTYNSFYTISVKTRDVSGNESPFSNQVSGRTLSKGLSYKYYTGDWTSLPDFNNTPIQSTGFVANVDLSPKTQDTKFGFLWEGFIKVPTKGDYTFCTISADGSKLYFNTAYTFNATPIVNNDNIHSASQVNSAVMKNLAAGVYPIAITYFQAKTTPRMEVYWKTPQNPNSFVMIPDSAFVEASPPQTGLPMAPSSLTATANSYNKISLGWTDNSNNESAFELMRSTDPDDGFAVIARLPANTTSFQDSTNLVGATKYYYRIRAINQNGESGYDKFGRGVDYYYYNTAASLTAIPDFNALRLVKTGRIPNFSLGMQTQSDNFAVKYESYINITSTGKYRFYISSDDGSRLYLNGNLFINNDGAHANSEKSDTITLQVGRYPISVTYFEAAGSEVLTVSYEKVSSGSPTVSKQIIPIAALGVEYTSATTTAAPPAPTAPFDLHVTSVTKSTVNLAWSNNDLSVSKYEVYRSFENNQDYVLYATATNNFYTDTVLFPNSNVFYKVKSVSATGKSDFSEELNVLTSGETPVIDAIETQYMRFGTQLSVYLSATIATSETISLSVAGLPSFGSFTSTGDGKGTIVFNNPLEGQQGTYNNIVVTATTPQGNSISKNFSLIVNNNYLPIITGQRGISVSEGQVGQVTFTASDGDAGDNISWSYQGLPSFVAVTNNAVNRTSILTMSPLIGSAGSYKVIAKADDGKNGKDTMAFVINVTSAKQVYIYFGPANNSAVTTPWNNIGKLLAANETFPATSNPGFQDKDGTYTNIRIKSDQAVSANTSGETTGTNSGIYPDFVMSSGYKINYANNANFTVTGLDKTKKYTFTFFSNLQTTYDNPFNGRYTINSDFVELGAAHNTKNVAKLFNVVPNDAGVVVFKVSNGLNNGSQWSYLNSLVIIESATDAQAIPSKITNFQIKFEDNASKLTWANTASNATGYEVYRANSIMGPYTLLNPGANNGTAQSYIDNTVQGNKTYYYMVRAVNSAGGNNSATQKIIIPNRAPILATVEAFCKTEQTTTINVTATDDVGETITLVATQLPPFVTFTDNGNGTGILTVSPAIGNKGVFNIAMTATDNLGALGKGTIKLYITDKNTSSIYVNFNSTLPVAGIWNNFNKIPAQGASISSLKNDMNVVTSTKVELVDAWTGSDSTGTSTGNNSGVYRDDILKTFYSGTGTTARRVKISGLSTDPNIRYNLVFLGNVNGVNPSFTIYSTGGKKDSLDVTNNTGKTVQLNDISATSGIIEFTVSKAASASASYLNALVIQSYVVSTTLLSPTNVKAQGIARDSIRLVWSNRVYGGTVEIYRSNSATGAFNYVGTASGESYTDFGLQANTEYFYKLKAVNSPNVSDFSNSVSASTFAYSVYINFNRENPAAQPWNNTNGDPMADDIYPYFVTDQNILSGITMSVGSGLSSTNASGENTGNNSGVVPDNVMRSTWWADIGQTGNLRFSGLSQDMKYSFTFFASRTTTDVRVTNYIINGRVVKLRVDNNRTRTVTMNNITPNQDGIVDLQLKGENGATFGYIGGLIISAYKIPSNPIDGSEGAAFRKSDTSNISQNTNAAGLQADALANKLEVYPNPFVNDITLKLTLNSNVPKLLIKVTDVSGRVVFSRQFNDIPKGVWKQPDLFKKSSLNPGVYFIQVFGIKNETIPAFRILKTGN